MIAGTRRALRWAQRFAAGRPAGATVLAYHLVGGGTASRVDIGAEVLRAQLASTRGIAEAVPLGELADRLRAGGDGAAFVVTFDDGYRNFAERAWPVLRAAEVPATLFVPVGFVEGECPPPLSGAELPALSWAQLRELARDPLVEIGSHSWTHPDLRRCSDAALERELGGSRQRLEERLDVPVRSFCYPRGVWDRRVEAAVAREYDLAVAGGGRRVTPRGFRRTRVWRTSVTRELGDDLQPVLGARVWLEELLADLWRHHGRRRRREAGDDVAPGPGTGA